MAIFVFGWIIFKPPLAKPEYENTWKSEKIKTYLILAVNILLTKSRYINLLSEVLLCSSHITQ